MRFTPLLLAIALQDPAPTDPHELCEWELLTHRGVWREPEAPWKDIPMWPGVTGGALLSGPYWAAPHVPAAPLALTRWSIVEDVAERDAARILAPWFFDPNAQVPLPAEPDPRRPKQSTHLAQTTNWSEASELGERTPVAAFTTFNSPRDEIRVACVSGARWFLWNGEPFIADRERYGFEGVPVHVLAGPNRVFVAADRNRFEFVLREPRSTVYVDHFDIVWPDGPGGTADDVGLNVFNASTRTVQSLCTHYGHQSGWSATCTPVLTDWRDGGYLAPLCLHRSGAYYSPMFGGECPLAPDVDHGCEYNAISVFTSDGSPAERLLLRRGSAWDARRANNTQNVARPAAGETIMLADVFADDAVHVYASRAREHVTLARARVLQQSTWYRRGKVRIVARDVDAQAARAAEYDYLKSDLERGQVVHHGNATTNADWPKNLPDEAPLKVVEGRVEIGGRVHEGDDLAGWFTSTEKGARGQTALFDTGPKGARLALLLATTWSGPRARWALFRVDASDARGWTQVDGDGPR